MKTTPYMTCVHSNKDKLMISVLGHPSRSGDQLLRVVVRQHIFLFLYLNYQANFYQIKYAVPVGEGDKKL